jgi:hypothetical protein
MAARIHERPAEATGPAALMVSLDALDDPRILNTVKVIDPTLEVETPRGPAWHISSI